jgi:type I restriction enzyme, S subunit
MKSAGYPVYKSSGLDWMKEIPAHWEVKKLRYLGDALIGLTYDPADVVSEDEGTLVLRSSNIQNGRITLDDNVYVSTHISTELITRDKDILICSRNGSRALVGKAAKIEGRAIGSSFGAFTTVFRSEINDFLFYVFNSQLFAFQAGRFMTTTINQLTTGTLKDLEVPIPPTLEQRAIADFLDRETETIDALIAKKACLIKLLSEKRQALITHAVTKGLDLNVQMKDSGEKWLGEIPASWGIVPSNRFFLESKERAREEDEHLSATQKYGVIPLAEFEHLEGRQVTHAEKNLEQRKHVEVDNFVISMRSFEGGIERVKARGCVRSSYVALAADKRAHVGFFSYLFKSSAYIQGLQATAMFVRDGQDLSYNNFRQVKLPFPSFDEQRKIADFLDREVSKNSALIAQTEGAINKLVEYRSTLISAAVTGQIDVRKYRAQGVPSCP